MNELNHFSTPPAIAKNSIGTGWRWFRQGLGLLFSSPGRWMLIGLIALLIIIVATTLGGLIPVIGNVLANWLVVAPITVGLLFCASFCYQRQSPELGNLFYGFQNGQRYGRIVLVNLVWSLLFFVFILAFGLIFVGLIELFQPQILQEAFSNSALAPSSGVTDPAALPAVTDPSHGATLPPASAGTGNDIHNFTLGEWLVLGAVGLLFAVIGLVLHYGQLFSSYWVAGTVVDQSTPKTLTAVSAGFKGAWRNLSALLLMGFCMSVLLGLFALIIALLGGLLTSLDMVIVSGVGMSLLVIVGLLFALLVTPWWACANLAAFRQIYPDHSPASE